MMMEVVCPHCTSKFETRSAYVNRAAKAGAPLYCGRVCAGLARRRAVPLTDAERKAAKSAYDAKRRLALAERLKAEKAAYFKRAYDPVKAAVERKARMPKHVEYCRRPEYREWKREYDRKRRANQMFGEFSDAFMLLQDIENEIAARATRYEIYSANGTLNKALQRRRSL
jgi:hypothetical protein